MKGISFVAGVIAGVSVAATIVSSCYPDVPRRMMRDSRRMVSKGKRFFC